MIYNLPSPKKIIIPVKMPVKGDLVNLDLDGNGAKQYRVLSVNGNVAKVMAMYDTLKSAYNSTSTTTTIGNLTVQKYEGSTLDTYLNTAWYGTLKASVKSAIVPESIVCDAWYWSRSTASGDPVYRGTYGTTNTNYSIGKYTDGTLNIGNRNVFALSVQDVIDYLNDSSIQVDTTAILRSVNIWKMFWNDEVQHYEYPFLRSSNASNYEGAFGVYGNDGRLGNRSVRSSNSVVRPALNLNLSQIEFSIVS